MTMKVACLQTVGSAADYTARLVLRRLPGVLPGGEDVAGAPVGLLEQASKRIGPVGGDALRLAGHVEGRLDDHHDSRAGQGKRIPAERQRWACRYTEREEDRKSTRLNSS